MNPNETHKRKVLIVEDNFDFYDLLSVFFQGKEFEIMREDEDSFVDSYAEAVRLCQENAPDIAILDIDLKTKDKDGIDLAYWLKAQFNIPIIFVSGKDDAEYAERLVDMPEVQYISKVATREELKGLWFNVQRMLPKNTDGAHYRVRTIPTDYFLEKKNSIQKFKDEYGNHRDKEQFFRYKMMKEIFVPDLHWGKNCVVIINANGKSYHIAQGSLSQFEEALPRQFIRINSRTIVNSDWIDKTRKAEDTFYIGPTRYTVSKNIQSTERTLGVLKSLFKEPD